MDLSAKPEKKFDLSLHLHSFPWESNNDLGTTENSCLAKSSATPHSGLVLEITTKFFISPLSSCSFTIRSDLDIYLPVPPRESIPAQHLFSCQQ